MKFILMIIWVVGTTPVSTSYSLHSTIEDCENVAQAQKYARGIPLKEVPYPITFQCFKAVEND